MLGLAKMLEHIEGSGHLVAVTKLNLKPRAGEPDSYEVELGISAFDRKGEPRRRPPRRPRPRRRRGARAMKSAAHQDREVGGLPGSLPLLPWALRLPHVPYDRLKDRLIAEFDRTQQKRGPSQAQRLEIDELDSYWFTGSR